MVELIAKEKLYYSSRPEIGPWIRVAEFCFEGDSEIFRDAVISSVHPTKRTNFQTENFKIVKV